MSAILLWLAPLFFLLLFYFYPLGSILQVSFARGDGILAPFLEIAAQPALRGVIGFTLWQATLSTILTLLLGLPAAYLFSRFQFRGKSLLLALTGIPFVMPTLVVAAGFNALLGARGLVNLALMQWFDLAQPPIQFANTLGAILIAHVFYNTTIVIRTVGDFWSRLDPRLEQAARTLGASRWQAFQQVSLPLLMPAIGAAALLVYLFNFTSFGVILILGGPKFTTLEVEIYRQTVSLFNLPLAAAFALIQLACTLPLTAGYTRLTARLARPLPMRSRQLTQQHLRGWRQRLTAGLLVMLLLLLLSAPLAALGMRSITRLDPDRRQSNFQPGLTLEYYQELFINRRDTYFYVSPLTAAGISLTYATATTLLSLLLGLPAAWALVKDGRSGMSRWMDPLLMLPIGTSSLTLGLGFIVALDQPPLDLRASPLLVPLAHTLVAFPFVVRSLAPALRSIRPQLRQAAAVLGAAPWRVFRLIDLPIAGRAVAVAGIFAFTISLGEFGATAILARPEFPTIPILIFRYLSQPGGLNYGQAMALSAILMLTTTMGMLFMERFRITTGDF